MVGFVIIRAKSPVAQNVVKGTASGVDRGCHRDVIGVVRLLETVSKSFVVGVNVVGKELLEDGDSCHCRLAGWLTNGMNGVTKSCIFQGERAPKIRC